MRFIDPVWLEGVRERRRTLKDIDRYIEPAEIYELIMNAEPGPYKTNQEFYLTRDRALISLLYSTGGRINEILRLKKDQFDMDYSDDFIVIQDFQISKRKKRTIQREGIPKIDMPLPKVGTFQKFTGLIVDYLEIIEDRLFKFKTKWAWTIINHMTGLWCHYFRCQKLSYDVNLLKSALTVARIRGVKSAGTIEHYYKTEWKEHIDKLKL